MDYNSLIMKKNVKKKKRPSKIPYILMGIILLGMLFVNKSPRNELQAAGDSVQATGGSVAETSSPSPSSPWSLELEACSSSPTPEPTPEPTPPIPVDSEGNFELYGLTFNLNDTLINLSHVPVSDNGEAVAQIIPFMPNLEAVDMDSCGVSNEAMAALRDSFPEIEIIWRVNFADNYSVRTNVTKILASKPSKGGTLTNESASVLKYCTNVHYLDLGHNEELTDLSFVSYMPELEIAVISMTKPVSLEPFSSCEKLVYLEAGNCGITDVSPLASCTALKHLNLGTNPDLSDISPIYNLELYRLWLGNSYSTGVSSSQMDEYQALHPDCEINREVGTEGEAYVLGEWKCQQQWSTSDWSYYAANNCFPQARPLGYTKVVYKAFRYLDGESAYSFSWNDPNYEYYSGSPVNTYLIDTSLLSEKWDYPDYNILENLIPDVLDDPPGDTIYVGKY